MNLKGAELEAKIQKIKEMWAELGGEVALDAKDIYDSRQHSFWYGGNIGTISIRGYKIYIDVCGEMVAKLRDKNGDEVASTRGRQNGTGFFHVMHPYIKDDSTLLAMSEGHTEPNDTEYSLGTLAENWIEFAVEDAIWTIVTDGFDCVLDTEDVLEAFICSTEELCSYIPE